MKTILLEQDPPYNKKDGGLFLYPSSPTSKDGVLVVSPPFYQALKLRTRFILPWIVSQAMQAWCKQNTNDSFQILRPINFVLVVHQIGGVLYNPATTKHGGSSSSTLVMTTSLTLQVFYLLSAFAVCTLSCSGKDTVTCRLMVHRFRIPQPFSQLQQRLELYL